MSMHDARGGMPSTFTIPSRRVAFLLVGLLLALGAVGTRTVWLQSVKNQSLSNYADGQQQNQQSLPAVRGDIVDRNGRMLAIGEEAVTFYGDPRLLKDPAGTALQISRVLGYRKTDEEALIQRLVDAKAAAKEDQSGFVYVARQVSREKAAAIEKLELSGIGWYDEEKRMYPNGMVAGQLIGAVDVDGRGIDGLESLYNSSLTGTPGTQVVVRDPQGVPIDVLKLQRERDGKDVQLTIDLPIQQEAERILAATVKRTAAKSATAIVMNPRTCEILAMANVPRANPAAWGRTPALDRKNRAVTDLYEPGSTFKVVAISGALEDRKVTRDQEFFLPPKMTFCDDKKTCTVKESHNRPTEWMTVERILVESSNIGTIKVAQTLRNRGFDAWTRRFGFGRPTGIDFPGEGAGEVRPVEQWSDVSIGNIPIGQGISVTPIQLASAYAAIANDGVLIEPHLLERIGDEPAAAHPSKRILSAKTAATMRDMFEGVVRDDRGTGKAAEIRDYEVGGKTGTANIAEKGQYLKGRYNSSFVGFVPAKNPKLVTLVVVNDTPMFGGQAAAPAFEQITELALRVLAIPPDGRT